MFHSRWKLLAVPLLAAMSVSVLAAAKAGWLTSMPEAQKQAGDTGRLILADFTGSDWCGWCVKLDKDVFSTDAFKSWARDKVVLLELDYPEKKPQDPEIKKQNKALKDKYGVRTFPTVVFISATGEELGRITGYKAPDKWMADARSIVEKSGANR